MTFGEALLIVPVVMTFLGLGVVFNAVKRIEAKGRYQAVLLEQTLSDNQRILTHILRIDGRLNRQEIYRRNADPLNYPVTNEDDMLTDMRRQLERR